MVNPNKASKARGKGGASPNKSNKFTPKKFGSPIRTKKVWGNYIDAYQTAVPWLVIGIPIRSDKHMSPWMKPIMEALEKDNGKLHSEMKLACVADRKGSKDEEGKYKPMKKGENYDAIYWECFVTYKDEEDLSAADLGGNLAEKLTKLVNDLPGVSLGFKYKTRF